MIFDNAKEVYRSILDSEFDSEFHDYLSNTTIAPSTHLAWIYVNEGDPQSAIQVMNTLIDELNVYLDDDFPELYILGLQKRAQIFALTFDYTSAIQDLDRAIELIEYEPMLPEAYKQRGDIIMLIYEWNRALEDYNTAIELDPDYSEAYYRRGILLYTMVEREDAIVDFEKYLALDRDGEFAESAQEYIHSIQIELDALGG